MIAHYLPSLFSVLVIKPLIILTLVLVIAFLIRKSSAARQHFLLALGIFSVLLLPFLHWLFPVIEWSVEPSASGTISGWLLALGQPSVSLDGGLWVSVLLGLYLVIALWLLFYLALGIAHINSDTHRMTECVDPGFLVILADLTYQLDINQPVAIVMGEEVDSPYMWGVFRPVIVLPADANGWHEDSKRSVLIHELAHVARRDWLSRGPRSWGVYTAPVAPAAAWRSDASGERRRIRRRTRRGRSRRRPPLVDRCG
jgi:beta-lactamase regulating signal transducer with metallopeptidase domain